MTAPPSLFARGSARIGGAAVFGALDLHVEAGRWTCLLGASGVGKSTLLRWLAGTADAVTFEGEAGADDGRPLQGRVALMAQTDLLMPWLSILENVLLGQRLRGLAADRAQARDILSRVGLAGFEARKPGALSGGQRQRVALARTLMEDRPVVLLDEPFSALDVATRARMQDLAARALHGRTVLHVTHDPAEAARLGCRIMILSRDRLDEVAAPASPPPRPPDGEDVLAATGRLTRLLLEAA
ncbi:ATP-binding cassette domain-containing protein [Fulvimarina sp. 2208YS6-2-32]|uniref:ATP-binding cassette domain-containing protein n=1 Tax=Fulvimarina uroteuthidis TaxID=3098149 RepID=A0ABU5I474_9HYPH|nr:ATP-binding cassette domain-containing protein [Fulvimarina sp. 2208YS6-2-32]MDY8110191.1 ATP-binding cassette domain-containing protein [Fulvimarina sp. 2208YS6-2-32]